MWNDYTHIIKKARSFLFWIKKKKIWIASENLQTIHTCIWRKKTTTTFYTIMMKNTTMHFVNAWNDSLYFSPSLPSPATYTRTHRHLFKLRVFFSQSKRSPSKLCNHIKCISLCWVPHYKYFIRNNFNSQIEIAYICCC